MPNDPVPPLEPWLGVLRADVQPMPEPARARVVSRLATTALVATAAVAAPATAQTMLRRGFVHSRLFAVALALPAGALIGAAGHAYWPRSVAPPAVVSAPRVSAKAVIPQISEVSEPPAAMPPIALEPLPAPTSSSRPPPAAASSVKSEPDAPSLERELSLLERARTRLSEGQPHATLQLLREHQLAYPTSALQQEREALTIRALMAAGRIDDARARAARFVEAYPSSALRGSVERAVAIP
jgi:hypothetical protein